MKSETRTASSVVATGVWLTRAPTITPTTRKENKMPQSGQDAPSRSLRHNAGEPLLYRCPVNACDKADERVRAQRDQREIQQEHHIGWHAENVSDIVVKHVEKRARPEEQADELAAPRQPHRAEQDWQPMKRLTTSLGMND